MYYENEWLEFIVDYRDIYYLDTRCALSWTAHQEFLLPMSSKGEVGKYRTKKDVNIFTIASHGLVICIWCEYITLYGMIGSRHAVKMVGNDLVNKVIPGRLVLC